MRFASQYVFVHSSLQREERTKKRRRGYRAIRSDADASFGGCGTRSAQTVLAFFPPRLSPLLPDKCGLLRNMFLFILLCSEKNEPRSAAAVIGLFARSPTRRLFCFAAKYLLFVIFAPIYSAYCKKMAYNFCFL